jgi:hypothetical protein
MKKILAFLGIVSLFFGCSSDVSFSNDFSGGGSGRGGSLARFTIVGNHLYVVNQNKLNTFDLGIGTKVSLTSTNEINAFAETIFPFKNHLLLGTRTGMFIYGLSSPANPNYISQYSHFASCDPVVAQGDHAYVTLRNGTPCFQGQNQLDVLDISNFSNPRLVNTTQMINPQGLSVEAEKLFICEGSNGFNLFELTDPSKPILVKKYSNVNAFDVIAIKEKLIITGDNGISQYHLDSNNELQLQSKISIGD